MFAIRFLWTITLMVFLSYTTLGQITINATMVNESTMHSNSNLTNNGTLSGSGTIDLEGNFTNAGNLTNTGSLLLGGDWTNSGNYSGDGVVNFLSSSTQTIDMQGGTFSVLSINGGGTKNLSSDANVSGTLELVSGNIDIAGGNSDLVILTNATINGGSPSSFINGALFIDLTGLSSVDYPVGENDVYLPILLDNIEASGVHGFEAIDDKLSSGDDFDELAPRHWERIEFGGSFSSTDVTLPLLGDEEFQDPNNITIVQTPDRGTNVIAVASSLSGGNTISSLEPVSGRFISIGEIGIPLIVMNVMTPNDDFQNDNLYIQNIEFFPDNEVQVINRWGTEVFSTSSYNNDTNFWNGTFNNKIVSPGNYIALIKTNKKTIRQTISVIR